MCTWDLPQTPDVDPRGVARKGEGGEEEGEGCGYGWQVALRRGREGGPAGKWQRGREAVQRVGWWLRCRRLDPQQPRGLQSPADPSSVLHFYMERAAMGSLQSSRGLLKTRSAA